MVTYTGQVTYSAASDENNRVFLKVMAYTGDVASRFETVCKSYSGNLTESGVRLFRGLRRHLCAYASLLRRAEIGCRLLDGGSPRKKTDSGT